MKRSPAQLDPIIRSGEQGVRKTALRLAIGFSGSLLFSGCGTLEPSGPDPKPVHAAECDVISQDDYFRLQGLGLVNKRFAYYCKRCNDKTPQGPFMIKAVSYKAVSSPKGSWGSLMINNQVIDPSSVLIETSPPNFESLVMLTKNLTGQAVCDPKTYQKKVILN